MLFAPLLVQRGLSSHLEPRSFAFVFVKVQKIYVWFIGSVKDLIFSLEINQKIKPSAASLTDLIYCALIFRTLFNKHGWVQMGRKGVETAERVNECAGQHDMPRLRALSGFTLTGKSDQSRRTLQTSTLVVGAFQEAAARPLRVRVQHRRPCYGFRSGPGPSRSSGYFVTVFSSRGLRFVCDLGAHRGGRLRFSRPRIA